MKAALLGVAVAAALGLAACEEQGSSGSGGGGSSGGGGGGGSAGAGSPSLRPQSVAGRADMSGIAQSVKAFQVNMERFPTNSEGLAVLVSDERLESDKDKWQGPYVQSMDMLKDTFGTMIEYENTGSGFILRNLGADGVRGGTGSSADIELRQPG